MILFARNMGRAPHGKSCETSARLIAERRELRITHPPPPVELFNNELAVQEELKLRCSELSG